MANVRNILRERKKQHGDFTDHAELAQQLRDIIRPHFGEQHTPVMRQSIETITDKIARVCVGDPNWKDHWDDIAGYATLASDRCEAQP